MEGGEPRPVEHGRGEDVAGRERPPPQPGRVRPSPLRSVTARDRTHPSESRAGSGVPAPRPPRTMIRSGVIAAVTIGDANADMAGSMWSRPASRATAFA